MSEYVSRVTRRAAPLAARLATLDIELTERCSNDCVHCCINLPEDDEAARSREMTTAQVERLLDEAAGLGCLRVRFTGGEPLLRPDFARLYLAARRLGLRVLIFTNARLVTPELADLLARVPPLLPLEVTVYGMHAESYEAVTRVPGSWDEFRRGVRLLLDRGVPFVVKGALLPPNRDDAVEFERWAHEVVGMTKPPSYATFFELRGRRDDPEKNRRIAALRPSPEEGVAFLTRRSDEYRRGMEEFAGKFLGPPGDRLFRCGAGRTVCLDAYGRAQPCMGVRAPELTVDVIGAGGGGQGAGPASPAGGGDPPSAAVATAPLAAALDRFAALGDLRATNPDYLRRCAACFLKGLCEQCPAKSWSEHGTLDTPVEYHCALTHAQARRLGWLSADEHSWEVADWRARVGVPSGSAEIGEPGLAAATCGESV